MLIINSDKTTDEVGNNEYNYCYCCGRITYVHVKTGVVCGEKEAWFICDRCDEGDTYVNNRTCNG